MTSSLLRFVTCGSVDDGKSTLIGRLLYDSKSIFEDQLASVEKASARYGTTGGTLDLALLTDGLKAEREQGITIDVAYRYFSTPQRPFIIADCPGHEQYTRNMATGASTAHVAILLIDARYGVVTQTRRHAFIVSLLGIRHVVLAVNKMDLVAWDQAVFDKIVADFSAANQRIGLPSVTAIPMSALNGDNVTGGSASAPWYTGPSLLRFLETVDLDDPAAATAPFRMPVQYVSRPDLDFRGYMGEVASGRVRPGDELVVLPAGSRARVKAVYDADGPAAELSTAQACTITLDREVDASRGDVLASADRQPRVATRLLAHVVWFSPEPLTVGTRYRIKHATRLATATVTAVRHRVDVNTLEHHSAEKLEMNDIALVELDAARPLVFDAYRENHTTGSFVLIDTVTGNTAAAGMIVAALSEGVESGPVTALQRAVRLGQRPAIVALTGSPAPVLETARALESLLFAAGHFCAVVDDTDPSRRAAALKALTAAGLIAISTAPTDAAHVAFEVAPAATSHDLAREFARTLRTRGYLTAPAADFDI